MQAHSLASLPQDHDHTLEFESLLGNRLGLELGRQPRPRRTGVAETNPAALTPPEPFDRILTRIVSVALLWVGDVTGKPCARISASPPGRGRIMVFVIP